MKTKVQRWGNSLAIRIPKPFAEELGVDHDSRVDISLEHGELVVKRLNDPTYSLADLVAGITDENLHEEVETGAPIGVEVW